MPKVIFSENLQNLQEDPRGIYAGSTVSEAIKNALTNESVLRDLVLNERGRLQPGIIVFINGRPLRDPVSLSDLVSERAEIWVMKTGRP